MQMAHHARSVGTDTGLRSERMTRALRRSQQVAAKQWAAPGNTAGPPDDYPRTLFHGHRDPQVQSVRKAGHLERPRVLRLRR
jgi:hypothetical protein